MGEGKKQPSPIAFSQEMRDQFDEVKDILKQVYPDTEVTWNNALAYLISNCQVTAIKRIRIKKEDENPSRPD